MTTPVPLAVKTDDPRAAGYERIAAFHRRLMEAKWRAQTAGRQLNITPVDLMNIAMHAEQAVTFLAEEVLRLGAIVEENRCTEAEGN